MANGPWGIPKNIAATLASLFAVGAGLIAVGGWAQYHFAGQKQLRHALCLSKYQTDLLAEQVLAGNAYARYLNGKIKVLEMNAGFRDDRATYAKVVEAERAISEERWKDVQRHRRNAVALLADYRSKKRCAERGGILWPAT